MAIEPAPHIMLVVAPYYRDITEQLVCGTVAELERAGATWERFDVAGAFEIPVAIAIALAAGATPGGRPRFDGYIGLGCVIRGETSHYDIVAGESARGLMDLGIRDGALIGNGILTTDSGTQARVRAAPDRPEGKDKGGDAARAALALLQVRRCMEG